MFQRSGNTYDLYFSTSQNPNISGPLTTVPNNVLENCVTGFEALDGTCTFFNHWVITLN